MNKEYNFLAHEKINNGTAHQITQHIRTGLMSSPFETLLFTVATSYMLGTLCDLSHY